MEGQMNKEQVIQATIGVLSEISVPVRLKAQIADPIDGAINNLAIVLQMIQVEKDANAQRQKEEPETIEREIGSEEEEMPGEEKQTGPVELRPEDVERPEEEAAEDGR